MKEHHRRLVLHGLAQHVLAGLPSEGAGQEYALARSSRGAKPSASGVQTKTLRASSIMLFDIEGGGGAGTANVTATACCYCYCYCLAQGSNYGVGGVK